FNFTSGAKLGFASNCQPINCFSADRCGRWFTSGGDDKNVHVYQIKNDSQGCYPRIVRSLQGHNWGIKCLCLSSDGRYALSACKYRINLWDVRNGKRIRTTQADDIEATSAIQFSPD